MGRPKKAKADVAHAVVKAALSAVPVAGGPLAELFAYLIEEPLSRRRDEWIQRIAGDLEELQKRLNRPLIEELRRDEGFTTVLVNASQIAVRTHQEQKIEALANAVMNSALHISIDDTERSIMLGCIDRLTPAHIAILRLFKDPGKNERVATALRDYMTGGLTDVIKAAFPELSRQAELVKLIWRELADSGLIGDGGALNVTMSGSGLFQKRTTTFGDRFLAFVSAPSALSARPEQSA